MVDSAFKVWLIEVNTNPCLDTGPLHLARIIPAMIENALRITLDPLFPPKKLLKEIDENRWELIYSLVTEDAKDPVELVSESEESAESDEEAQ
jgi:tubulin--tyrosine ligase